MLQPTRQRQQQRRTQRSASRNGATRRRTRMWRRCYHARIGASRLGHCCRPGGLRITSRPLMCFSERRARLPRRRSAAARRLAAATAPGRAVAALARSAAAAPLDEPFVGGLSFTGPTSRQPGRGLLEPGRAGPGARLPADGGRVRRSSSTVGVNRASIDPTTGAPGGSMTLPAAPRRAISPGRRRSGPHSYFALARTSAAIASRSPSRRTCPTCSGSPFRCRPTGNEPTRYQVARARPAQPGAGAGAVDPVRRRLPHRLRARVPVLDRAPELRRGHWALDGGHAGRRTPAAAPVRRREPGGRRPLRHRRRGTGSATRSSR